MNQMRRRKRDKKLPAKTPGKRLGDLPALLASLPHLSEEEATSFAEDLDAARAELGRAAVGEQAKLNWP